MSTLEFSRQISLLHPILHAFTRRFTSDKDESFDLVQDTLLRALVYKDKFRENSNLKGWLFTIMRNTFINQYRRNKRAKTSHDRTKELYQLNVEDKHTFHKPDTNFEYADILKHVNELREEILIPFKLHTTGYKYNEIAEQLNIPIGTVKNRIFQARKELQSTLTGY